MYCENFLFWRFLFTKIAGLKSVRQKLVLKRGISCKRGCVPCSDVLDGPKQMHIMTWNFLSSTQRHTENGELEV